jgi:hypothetical protein
VATPEKKRPTTLDEAVDQLKRDPLHPVRLHVNDVDIEVHLVKPEQGTQRLGDFMAEGGGWKGESPDEILRILREARKSGGTAEPPSGL